MALLLSPLVLKGSMPYSYVLMLFSSIQQGRKECLRPFYERRRGFCDLPFLSRVLGILIYTSSGLEDIAGLRMVRTDECIKNDTALDT